MTTVNTIAENAAATASQSSASLLDRLINWMNCAAEGLFGPSGGEAAHNQLAAYPFLIPSYCGAVVDSDLWDLLIKTEEQARSKRGEANNV
jgi:hypothetical protein